MENVAGFLTLLGLLLSAACLVLIIWGLFEAAEPSGMEWRCRGGFLAVGGVFLVMAFG